MTKQEKQAVMDTATPRPWHKCKLYADDIRGGSDTQLVASTYDVNGTAKPNRELIVLAVNSYEALSASHERLVKALEQAKGRLEDIAQDHAVRSAATISQADDALAAAREVQNG